MSNEKPKYKTCKYCQQEILQTSIYNHQRLCNQKQIQQPEFILKNQNQEPIEQEIKKNIQNQNDQTNQTIPMHLLNNTVPEKYRGRVTILNVKPLPTNEFLKSQQEQSKQNIYLDPYQEQPKQNIYVQPYQPYQEQPKQNINLQSQPQPQNFHNNNQYDIYNLPNIAKCDHCNCHVNSSEIEFHQMNCSSYLRFLDILNEDDIQQQQNCQFPNQPSNNNKVKDVTKNLQILSQYLQIQKNFETIITKGKKLFDLAIFKSLKFRKTFDQRYCYFCKDYFKEEEIIYNMECCLIKCHKKCLHKIIIKSTKCYNCQKPLFPSKVLLNK